MNPPRVISLLPSATEIVCALGCSELLVGRSHECDYPPGIAALPACTSTNQAPSPSSETIGHFSKSLAEQARSLYRVDAAKLRELRPDLILTQDGSDADGVIVKQVMEAVAGWPGQRPRIVSLAPRRLADLWETFRQVADALGLENHGKSAVAPLKARVVRILESACAVERRPSVACLECLDPLMAAGNWVPDMAELAGGTNLFSAAGKDSVRIAWEELINQAPDIIVLMARGMSLDRVREELPALTERQGWTGLAAVQNGHVHLTDGRAHFNRPGPRLVDSMEILAELLQPKLFNPVHEGKGWQRI